MHDGHPPHSHDHHAGAKSKDKDYVLLGYMSDHNRQHAQEFCDLAEKLKSQGRDDVSDLIAHALECFEKGNSLLEAAVDALGQNTEGGNG